MNKKIYCAGPISGDITYQENYKKMIEIVRQNGFYPLYEPELKPNYVLTDQEIYRRDINWLNDAIGMIAEVSGPSLGVGFEIAYALFQLKKPVLALYHESIPRLSAMIKGCDNSLLSVQKYKDEFELEKFIKIYLQLVLK
ncbi:MAG: nucleoside 2-deoxyribosyltransferase [Ignavibacteria bacterium]